MIKTSENHHCVSNMVKSLEDVIRTKKITYYIIHNMILLYRIKHHFWKAYSKIKIILSEKEGKTE